MHNCKYTVKAAHQLQEPILSCLAFRHDHRSKLLYFRVVFAGWQNQTWRKRVRHSTVAEVM